MLSPRSNEAGRSPHPAIFCKQPIYYKANRFDVIGTDDDVVWPDLAAETLIEFCRDHLASFKKPKRIESLAELPKNLGRGEHLTI